MKREMACGAIIYRLNKGKIEFLIVQQKSGFWSLPKGHMEDGETEVATAYREVLEETGLKIKFDEDFRYEISYSPKKDVLKIVTFFIGEIIGGEIKPQKEEIKQILWLGYYESLNILTYDNVKVLLERAFEYLVNEKNIGN